MSKNLMSLSIQALDEYAWIDELQQILEICMEQLDNPTEKTELRVGLLISLYNSAMTLHLDELRVALEAVRSTACTIASQVQEDAKNA